MSRGPADPPPALPARRLAPAQVTLLVVCVVSVYFLVGFYGKSLDSYRIGQRAAQIRREVAALEAKNRLLQERVAYLATDAYVEMAARDKLSLVKPGDRLLIVVADGQDAGWVESPPPGDEPARPPLEFGHLADWLDLFFGPR
jgi:cell division protein FtsB